MSGPYPYEYDCPNCGMDMECWQGEAPWDNGARCYQCGLYVDTYIKYESLKVTNEWRQMYELEPLERLPHRKSRKDLPR